MSGLAEFKCRNNADARRIGAGQIRIPGAANVRHTGGKTVKAIVLDESRLRQWADAAFEIDSYEITVSS